MRRAQTVEQYGIYAHNQVEVTDRLFESFGLRQTWVENRTDDRLYGDDTSQNDNKLVWDVGATYDLGSGVVPYASYASGFVVNTGADFDGNIYQPTEAEQLEIGLPAKSDDDRFLLDRQHGRPGVRRTRLAVGC